MLQKQSLPALAKNQQKTEEIEKIELETRIKENIIDLYPTYCRTMKETLVQFGNNYKPDVELKVTEEKYNRFLEGRQKQTPPSTREECILC